MTFTEAIESLKVTVMRDDLESSFLDFLNLAVREVADDHNWDQLKKTGAVTILAATRAIALPADFKAWQNGRFCAEIANAPVPVYTRTELERLVPLFRPTTHLIYTQDNDAKQIALPANVASNTAVSLYYFGYPATVSDISLTTPLLRDYSTMVLSKARSLIFASINDPAFVAHESNYQKELLKNSGGDVSDSNPAPDPAKE